MDNAIGYPHIIKVDGKPARLESHPRVRVAQIVMDYLAYGWSADEIHRQHPHLALSEVHAAMDRAGERLAVERADQRIAVDARVERGHQTLHLFAANAFVKRGFQAGAR